MLRRAWNIAAVALVSGLLCLSASQGRAQDPVWEGVVRQNWDLSCGAAALATVLTYQQGDKVSEREVIAGLLHYASPEMVKHRGGFSMLDLKRYAESRGFAAEGYGSMTIGDLEAFGPAIIRMTTGEQHHFVVFLGVQGDQVHLADPATGNRYMNLSAFEVMWDQVALKITRAAGYTDAPSAGLSPRKQSGSWNISTPARE